MSDTVLPEDLEVEGAAFFCFSRVEMSNVLLRGYTTAGRFKIPVHTKLVVGRVYRNGNNEVRSIVIYGSTKVALSEGDKWVWQHSLTIEIKDLNEKGAGREEFERLARCLSPFRE